MRIHYIMHVPFENPGIIVDWAKEKGYQLTGTHTYLSESFPDPSEFDMLTIMGGPQSAVDLTPELSKEVDFIKEAIKANKAIVGFCLGAQLIGEALGAKTEKSPNKEVGSYPVELTESGKNDPILNKFPEKFDVMHWHGDMPGIPEDAELLMKSEGCPRQVFRYGDRIYGFQCHMEMKPESIRELIANCPEDLTPGKYISSKDELLETNFESMNSKMIMVLDHLTHMPVNSVS